MKLLFKSVDSFQAKASQFEGLHQNDFKLLQSFRGYMVFKRDFNGVVLHLLRELVKDALQFEEIMSGSAANISYIDVKVVELQSKVI